MDSTYKWLPEHPDYYNFENPNLSSEITNEKKIPDNVLTKKAYYNKKTPEEKDTYYKTKYNLNNPLTSRELSILMDITQNLNKINKKISDLRKKLNEKSNNFGQFTLSVKMNEFNQDSNDSDFDSDLSKQFENNINTESEINGYEQELEELENEQKILNEKYIPLKKRYDNSMNIRINTNRMLARKFNEHNRTNLTLKK